MKHFIVFIGASPSLSTELLSLQRRFRDVVVIAPAAKKNNRGLNEPNIEQASEKFIEALRSEGDQSSAARLSVWSFTPPRSESIELLWHAFGRSAWIEYLPVDLINKDQSARLFIEQNMQAVVSCLHQIYLHAFGSRKTSPLPLPFENFRSSMTSEFHKYWYRGLNSLELKRYLEGVSARFRQMHTNRGKHRDERHLLFSPALDTECHAKTHPTGTKRSAFINGRFRFGSALFPGFHYDVRDEKKSTLDCLLTDSDGSQRAMKSERREYINIYPNNHLLPAR